MLNRIIAISLLLFNFTITGSENNLISPPNKNHFTSIFTKPDNLKTFKIDL